MTPNASDMCSETMSAQEPERKLLRLEWSMAELRKDLALWGNNYTVQVTMEDEGEPEKIWMVFTRDDSGD